MREGITVGELRELLSTQELLDLLDKLNIDTGTFGQILTVINKLPGILDSVRISFGTPNRAGLYTVAVVTDGSAVLGLGGAVLLAPLLDLIPLDLGGVLVLAVLAALSMPVLAGDDRPCGRHLAGRAAVERTARRKNLQEPVNGGGRAAAVRPNASSHF